MIGLKPMITMICISIFLTLLEISNGSPKVRMFKVVPGTNL